MAQPDLAAVGIVSGVDARPVRRWHLVAALVLGLGLIAAPAIFQMFSRAPAGGDMIADFEPYMHTKKIDAFRAELTEIGAARDEADAAITRAGPDSQTRYPSINAFRQQWPAIDADMRSMLTTMEHNIGNYDGVAALPPFALFPWFFVIPGVLIAGVAGWSLVTDRGRPPGRGRRIALTALAVGLVAAPAVFQMFTRAPGGATMIDGFKPFMTPAKVTTVQGYFLTIGAAEGQMRRSLVADVAAANGVANDAVLPAVHALNHDWPAISGDMAPMVGTMADNVHAFAGIAALPPFGLFPWFFVIPGVALVVLTWRSSRTVVGPLPTAAPAAAVPGLRRRKVLQLAAGGVVVAELVTLTAMNLTLDRSTTTSAKTLSRAAAPAPATVAAPVATVTRPVTRVAAAFAPAATTAPPVEAPAVTVPTTAPPPPAVVPDTPAEPALSCALPLPAPPPGGGVASLTPLVPAFGPYSAEAFAMMPAFAPLMRLFGPFLVAGQTQLESAQPVLSALLPVLQQLETAGFTTTSPLYGPNRQQVLDAEKTLADQLAQLATTAVETPGTGCLPALEGMLTGTAP